jgi:hypothetical protein
MIQSWQKDGKRKQILNEGGGEGKRDKRELNVDINFLFEKIKFT